ncbi:MAG: short-chain dehydrogenase [Ferruginibacter sp.]
MTSDLIEKFIESKEMSGQPVNIFFRQRSTINGLFVQAYDYKDMKAKNFWRIVPATKAAEWNQTKDINLTRLFSGTDFLKIK